MSQIDVRMAGKARTPVGRGVGVVAVLAVVALLGAACSRSSKDVATNTSSTSTTAASGGSLAAGKFGTMDEAVCGKAPAGQTNKATGRGVTADEIRLGTIADPGYPGAPGLDQELFDASTVFTKWCNSLGGINGRLIKDDLLDAAVVNYKAKVEQACQQDFALVGGGGVLDNTGQQARLSCLLPDYPAYLVTPEARGADLTIQVTPGPNNSLNFGLARYLVEKYPDAVDHVGYLTGNVSTTITNKDQYEEAGTKLGFGKPVYDAQYNSLGEPTWTPIAQAIASHGVKGLYFVGQPEGFGQLIAALASINYKLDWIAAAGNQYDPKTLATAGSAVSVEPVYVQVGTTPFQLTDVPAVSQYEQLFSTYLPNSTRKQAALGENSFSAWLLFAKAAKACGADLTPKCVYDNAKKVTNWDGGGIQAPSNPSNGLEASPCMVIVKAATGSTWDVIKWDPTSGPFNCDSANVVALHGNYGTGVKLSDVGKSMSDLP
jgi:hypothetical protein